MIRAIVTDIEGTTSSLSFVKETLFPYAASRLADFVKNHAGEKAIQEICNAVRSEIQNPLAVQEEVIETLLSWAREDRKIGPLKTLQGLIWDDGYARGDFRGHVYSDTAPALRRWQAAGIKLYVYSSGSVHAQKLLFSHSIDGDMTALFSGYFDTSTGGKKEVESYRRIAKSIGFPPEEILFLSDIVEELDAAANAGMKTYQLVRQGEIEKTKHPVARDFTEIRSEIYL